jgi:hypothetical protein
MSAAREPLITPAELAKILQVSINTARRIMREQGVVFAGAQLRWTTTKLERYLRLGGSGCTNASHSKNGSSCEDESSPSRATTTPANDTQPAPTKPTDVPRLTLLEKSKPTAPYLQPIQPATARKRSRSRKR